MTHEDPLDRASQAIDALAEAGERGAEAHEHARAASVPRSRVWAGIALGFAIIGVLLIGLGAWWQHQISDAETKANKATAGLSTLASGYNDLRAQVASCAAHGCPGATPVAPPASVVVSAAVGPQGLQGIPGLTIVGSTGPQGPRGLPGQLRVIVSPSPVVGPAGVNGSNGGDGSRGPKGDTGPAGPTGAVGPTGAPGSDGATGATGPPPSSFQFVFLGITYVCTPDAPGSTSYTCTPAATPTPTPTPSP